MESPYYGAQFALVIEFYLRCCGDHIEELNKISNTMSKIGLLYEKVTKKGTLDEVSSCSFFLNNFTVFHYFSIYCMWQIRQEWR